MKGRPAQPEKIDERTLTRHLYAPDMPDPDLLVRLRRVPDLELPPVAAAYAELYFSDVLWPDFRREHLFGAIAEYQKRERRFGSV